MGGKASLVQGSWRQLRSYIYTLDIAQPVEGEIKFGDISERDLKGFLKLCKAMEIFVICRPGPYQYSEMKYDRLPGWLCENYPEILARDITGNIFRQSSVSYLHPVFLKKVRNWFEVVCPIIARHTVLNGGAVAFAQFDNELMGIHEWFGSWDYNDETMGFGKEDGRYARFLQERYVAINKMNSIYNTNYTCFAEVRPYNDTRKLENSGRIKIKDYQDFYFSTIAEYASILVGWFRELGIDCDLMHNSGNPTMNSYFLETAAKLGKGFIQMKCLD